MTLKGWIAEELSTDDRTRSAQLRAIFAKLKKVGGTGLLKSKAVKQQLSMATKFKKKLAAKKKPKVAAPDPTPVPKLAGTPGGLPPASRAMLAPDPVIRAAAEEHAKRFTAYLKTLPAHMFASNNKARIDLVEKYADAAHRKILPDDPWAKDYDKLANSPEAVAAKRLSNDYSGFLSSWNSAGYAGNTFLRNAMYYVVAGLTGASPPSDSHVPSKHNRDRARAVFALTYGCTQAFLAHRGMTLVRSYRGVRGKQADELREYTKVQPTKLTGLKNLTHPLSSWASDPTVARQFSGHSGVVLSRATPAHEVFALHLCSNIGYANEREVVPLAPHRSKELAGLIASKA